MINHIKILSFFLLLSIFGCKKANRFDCIKRTGELSFEKRMLQNFTIVEVKNNFQLFLIQDSINFMEIEAGRNLIENIESNVIENRLLLSNNNKCNFTRSYKNNIKLYLHFKKLDEIVYGGTGPITSLNAITNENFTFNSWDGTDSIKLNLEVTNAFTNIHTGVADLIVVGHCKQLYAYARSSGVFRMQNFVCKNVYTNNISSSDQFFYVQNKLEALVQYLGNTYYQGSPNEIVKTINNKGKLIKL